MPTLLEAAQHARENAYAFSIRRGRNFLSLELLNYARFAENGYCFFYEAKSDDNVEHGHVAFMYVGDGWEQTSLGGGGRRISDGPRPAKPVDLVGSGSTGGPEGTSYADAYGFVNDPRITQVRVTYDCGDIAVAPVIGRTFLVVIMPTHRPSAQVVHWEGLDDNDHVLYVQTRTPNYF